VWGGACLNGGSVTPGGGTVAAGCPDSNVLTLVMPIKTEEGIAAFGIVPAVWDLTFLIVGLQILRQDMNESNSSIASVESSE